MVAPRSAGVQVSLHEPVSWGSGGEKGAVMARHSWKPVGCALAVVAVVLGSAPAASAALGAEVTVVRSTEDSATVTFDLADMPSNAVLVVERRLGPKSPYVEVVRTARDAGVVSVDLPDARRAVVRTTVLGTRGSVLLRTETRL
jgi:hypothetical protein